MMVLTLFRICWVVFVFTKISAAVDTDSSNENALVKELANKKDPVDFRFTKFVDIRFDVDKSTPHLQDVVRPNIDGDSKGIEYYEKNLNNLNNQDRLKSDKNNNEYLLNELESLTYQIRNVSEILMRMNSEMAGIRKNISLLSENQISIRKGIYNERFPITKSSVGLYPRTEPVRTKDNQTVNIPTGCEEVQDRGNHVSGVYEIHPKHSPKPFLVLCDMEIKGGGWTHIQKRFDGSQDFNFGWREYKFGFGDLDGEFWLGLENIHFLTSAGAELLIEITDIDQNTAYAHYRTFEIGPEPDGYLLGVLNGFSGDAGDSLSDHIGRKFSTKDYDQDTYSENCADIYHSGWWFVSCYSSNLNGKYINLKVNGEYQNQGPRWNSHHSHGVYSLSKTRMLVR